MTYSKSRKRNEYAKIHFSKTVSAALSMPARRHDTDYMDESASDGYPSDIDQAAPTGRSKKGKGKATEKTKRSKRKAKSSEVSHISLYFVHFLLIIECCSNRMLGKRHILGHGIQCKKMKAGVFRVPWTS